MLQTERWESLQQAPVKWAKVIDHRRCIGCHACTIACKMEHLVPLGVNRTYVKQVDVGTFPHVRRHFQITRCNQCDHPPCVEACPTAAMYRRPDGIVDFDRDICIGCKACMAACPYDAIYIDPDTHSAEKCNFCTHRVDVGLEPACVVVCPTEAIIVGDMSDPGSLVSQIIARDKVEVRKPEKATLPKLFYVEASEYTLTPTAAAVPASFYMAEAREGYPAGEPTLAFSGRQRSTDVTHTAAAAMMAYDTPHKPPWGWMVSAYTWTKSVASGVYLLPAILALSGLQLGRTWDWLSPIVATLFLLITAGFLVGDLTHPKRFLLILARPQWKSWLARGAFILTAYGALLALALVGAWAQSSALTEGLRWPGIVLAALAAIYTAFLFAQAKGRDFWQNPLLPVHFFVQALVAGAAAVAIARRWVPLPPGGESLLRGLLMGAVGAHLALALSELVIPHPTADAIRALRHMVRGVFAQFYWAGVVVGGVLPLLLLLSGRWMAVAGALALVGLLAYEHAYVRAGQSIPLS